MRPPNLPTPALNWLPVGGFEWCGHVVSQERVVNLVDEETHVYTPICSVALVIAAAISRASRHVKKVSFQTVPAQL